MHEKARRAFEMILGRRLSRLRRLIHFVTFRCGGACPFCCVGARRGQGMEAELSAAEIRRAAATAPRTGKLELVTLTGGDPFLRDDLPEIAAAWAGVCRKLAVPTYGDDPERVLAGVKRILAAVAAPLCVGVSLDGPPEVHDGLRRSPGLWQRAVRTLEGLAMLAARERRLDVTVLTTLHPDSAGRVLDWARAFQRERGVVFDLEAARKGPLCAAGTENKFDAAALRGAALEICAGNARLKPAAAKYQYWAGHKILFELSAPAEKMPRCGAARTIGVVYPDGALAGCEQREAVCGLRDYGLDLGRAWRGPEMKAERRAVRGCACTHGCFVLHNLDESFPYRRRVRQKTES